MWYHNNVGCSPVQLLRVYGSNNNPPNLYELIIFISLSKPVDGLIIRSFLVIFKENVDQNVLQDDEAVDVCVREGGVSFLDLYNQLPGLCPSHEARDLSPPIAFVALLHMCNEKVSLQKLSSSFDHENLLKIAEYSMIL